MLPMFKRGLAHAARPVGGAQGTPGRVILPVGALLFLLLVIAATTTGSSSNNNNNGGSGLFCNSALRQRAEAADRAAAAAATTAAALRSAHAGKAAEAASAQLRAASSLALDLVLPLTNLSALTTAQVLDAARASHAAGQLKASALPARLRAAVQGHQALACASGQARPSEDMSAVRFGNATLYVYKGNDIVSDHLAGEGHMWEEPELKEFLWAIRAPVPGRPDGFPGSGGGSGGSSSSSSSKAAAAPPPPLAIDIGANIGWFMLNAAAAGARVAAFEAMEANIRLLRATLCANDGDLSSRVALYGTGVGADETECVMISGNVNRGDGHTICGEQANDLPKLLADLKKGTGYEYASRGKMTVRRLDRMLVGGGDGDGRGGGGTGVKRQGEEEDDDDDAAGAEGGGGGANGGSSGTNGGSASGSSSISAAADRDFDEAPAVVKIDIEGFEEQALKGADGLLLNPRTRPWFLLTEANLGLLKDGGGDYMRFLQSRGYALSQESFRGPFFTDASIEKGDSGYSGQNLYCTRRDWLETAEGRRVLGPKGPRWVGVFPAEARQKLEG